MAAIEDAVRRSPNGVSAPEILRALTMPAPPRTLQYRLKHLVTGNRLIMDGKGRWARYRLPDAAINTAAREEVNKPVIPLSEAGTEIRDYVRQVSRSAQTDFVLDALEQALHERRPVHRSGLVHHSDRGSQYVSIRYTERLAEAGIEPSVGSVGDSYDNALAETVNGLFKAEVIHRRGPWRNAETVEFATLEWVDWFNNRGLLEPIGNIPPVEAEARYYEQINDLAMVA